MRGNVQINDRVLKTLLVSKIRLCVVFLKLFIPLHQTFFDGHFLSILRAVVVIKN